MKVLVLPKCDVKIPVIVDMLAYLYNNSVETLERGFARSDVTYSTYHISLFQLSLRFYLPELERIAFKALDQEEIGIQEGAYQDMEGLIVEMYKNRRGKKWDALRKTVIKRQAWKLIKMPRKTLDRLEDRFPGFRTELALVWRLKMQESGAIKGSWWLRWKR